MKTNTLKPVTAVAYTRVSTQDQADSGLGIEAQRAAIEGWAKRTGTTIVAWFTDEGVSGSIPVADRPAGSLALMAVKRGAQLVVAKRDRLGRDSLDVQLVERELNKRGARLVSAAGEGTEADDPTSVFLRRTLDAVGELERGMIRARTKAAMRAKIERGERFTRHAPTGFIWADDRLQVNADEQRILAAIDEAMTCGCGLSLRCIAARLAEQGLLSRSGKPFTATAIRRLRARIEAQAAA
jgi:DNA invertase Pin-like site-specific DNA recombinase